MERGIKELLQILLSHVDTDMDSDDINCFCLLTNLLEKRDIISLSEESNIDDYVISNMPKYTPDEILSVYGWGPGDIKARKTWLEEQISIL